MLLGVLGQSRDALHAPHPVSLWTRAHPELPVACGSLAVQREGLPQLRDAVVQTSASEPLTPAPSSQGEKEGALPMLHRTWK